MGARQQIYPFKEERIGVEGLCKYACMAGGGSGGLVFLVRLGTVVTLHVISSSGTVYDMI